MKSALLNSIFFTALSFLAVSAFGNSSVEMTDSWSVLAQKEKRGEVYYEMPSYKFSGGMFFRASHVCLSGPKAQVIEPIKVKRHKKCLKLTSQGCEKEIVLHPTLQVEGSRYGCMVRHNNDPEGQCLFWGYKPYRTQTKFTIAVYSVDENFKRSFLFDKELTLPLCKDVD